MSNPNGILLPFVLLLVYTTLFSPKCTVSAEEPNFKRPDPVRHFHYYRGRYDVRNKHYWASAAFTGAYGYAIGVVWLLCGLGFGIFLIVKKPSSGSWLFMKYLGHHYFLMFLMVLLFTVLAIVASSFVLAANHSTLWRTEKIIRTIVTMGRDASQTIQKVITSLTKMQSLLLPYDPNISMSLNTTIDRLGRESHVIRRFVDKNGHSIDHAIQSSHIVHLVIVTINLVLLVAAIVLLSLHWHPGFIAIIFCCWILTTLCWVLTGIDFFLHNFGKDTCSAFVGFEQDPHNSSLSSLLPCKSTSFSQKLLVEIGNNIHTFIDRLNSKISEYYKMLGLDSGFKLVCQPFSGAPDYSYLPYSCPKDAIQVGDLPKILAEFTCYKQNSSKECQSKGKLLPEGSFNMISAYSYSVQSLLDVYPDVQSLVECTFVKDRFSDVVSHQCKPFSNSIRLLWSSMLSLSIFMVVLVLIWVTKAYQDRGRSFTMCSITPNL